MIRLLAALALLLAAPAAARSAPTDGGAVSAAQPLAAEAGREILRAGGSAVDAAIAVALALTVVEPQSSGIGGGGFILWHDARTGRAVGFDGREMAPAAAGPDWFLGPDGRPLSRADAVPGGRSVGVPGTIRLMALAHGRGGRLPWKRLFAPAIRLAKAFPMNPRLHEFLDSRADRLGPWARAYLLGADGRPKPVGTILRNPDLARALGEIARRGPDAFYTGARAGRIVATVNGAARNPSRMTAADLAGYRAKERPVPCGRYRQWTLCGMGPPSSGATTVFAMLKQLERFDLHAMGKDSPVAWHLIAQSMRLAYADRDAFLADADHVPVPVAGLMDPAYLTARGAALSPERALAAVAPGTPAGAPPRVRAEPAEVPGTSHIAVADGRGDVVTYTSTIEGPFGSGLTVDGFFLNNELTDFELAPGKDGFLVANRVQPGKRPRSSMSPTIVYGPDGTVRIALGAAGGGTIPAQVAKTLIGVLDWGLTAEQAIGLPQIYAPGERTIVERGTPLAAMTTALERLGDRVTASDMPLKGNAVERVGGRWIGATDPRLSDSRDVKE